MTEFKHDRIKCYGELSSALRIVVDGQLYGYAITSMLKSTPTANTGGWSALMSDFH